MEEEEVYVGKGVEQVLLMGQGFLASVMCSTDNEKKKYDRTWMAWIDFCPSRSGPHHLSCNPICTEFQHARVH